MILRMIGRNSISLSKQFAWREYPLGMEHSQSIRDARSKEQARLVVHPVFSAMSLPGGNRLAVTKPCGAADLKD